MAAERTFPSAAIVFYTIVEGLINRWIVGL